MTQGVEVKAACHLCSRHAPRVPREGEGGGKAGQHLSLSIYCSHFSSLPPSSLSQSFLLLVPSPFSCLACMALACHIAGCGFEPPAAMDATASIAAIVNHVAITHPDQLLNGAIDNPLGPPHDRFGLLPCPVVRFPH